LRNQDEDVEDKSDPGPNNARLGAKRKFGEVVALDFPRAAESDVSEANGAPGEDTA